MYRTLFRTIRCAARAGLPLASLLLCTVFSLTPIAIAEETAAFSEQDRADIARIQAYMNSITTVKSGFIQVATDGSVAQGTLYVSRPGKLRVEYDPPVKILMVATGIWFIFYDGELGETTYLPFNATPISIILKENIDLERDAHVVAIKREPGLLRLTITGDDDKDGSDGAIMLAFSEKPLRLKQWIVRDQQGQTTKLALLDPRFDIEIAPERFLFISPNEDDNMGTR